MTIHEIIDLILSKKNLSKEQSGRIFQMMMMGGVTPPQIAAIISGMRINGETIDEITGAATSMRRSAKKFDIPQSIIEQNLPIIDTCGTGGDGKSTLNISTAVAFVLAGCGVPIVKHGNKAISSKSGSADVLQELGVTIDADTEYMQRALEEANICFLMAPKYHLAMRHVAPVRNELKARTIFNILGPLINPASPTSQLTGVYDRSKIHLMASVLKELGLQSAWVVHGEDGMDEITLFGKTHIASFDIDKDDEIKKWVLDPTEYGIPTPESEDEIKGGNAVYNARALKSLLSGDGGAYRDAVLINAAAALAMCGIVNDISSGIEKAATAIDNGKAKDSLSQLIEISSLSLI